MPDPQSLIAVTAFLALAILSAIGVWTLKGLKQRRSRMSRSELQALGEAADRAERQASSFTASGGP